MRRQTLGLSRKRSMQSVISDAIVADWTENSSNHRSHVGGGNSDCETFRALPAMPKRTIRIPDEGG